MRMPSKRRLITRKSKPTGTFSKVVKGAKMGYNIAKQAGVIENQEMFERLSMPALTIASRSIELMKKASAGRTLPAFSGANRKVVIPTVSTGTVSTSVYGYKYNDKPIARKTGDQNIEVRKNAKYTFTTTANSQSVLDVPLLSCSRLVSGANNYTSVTYQQAFESSFNVGGDSPTIPLSSTARDQNRIALDRFESTLKLVNESSGPMEVNIYDLFPKRDMPRGTYSSRFRAFGLISPFDTWTSGLTNAIDIDSTENSFVMGTTPTTNLKFNTFWKVMKRTKIELSSGSTHIHRGSNILNTMFNYYDYSEVLGLRAYLSPTIMLVVNGLPTSTELADSVTLAYSTENVLFGRSSVNDNITVRSYDSSTS